MSLAVPPAAALAASREETLLTTWPAIAVTATVAAIVSVVVVAWWRRADRRPTSGRVVGVVTVTLVWVLVAAAGVNVAQKIVPDIGGLTYQAQAWVGIPISYRTPHGGHVREMTVPADAALAVPEVSVWVYTPPGFDNSGNARYPVVYLIHGYPGDAASWFTLGRADLVVDAMIASGAMPPTIVVSPDVNGGGIRDSECLDARNGPKVETWLYTTLIPHIDATLPTKKDRGHRILGGFSMGGYCAIDQGLRHQDVWGAMFGVDPYGDPGDAGPSLLGDQQAVSDHSPSQYLSTMTFTHPMPTYLVEGGPDDGSDGTELADLLRLRGQHVGYRDDVGMGHTWELARRALPYALLFTSQELRW